MPTARKPTAADAYDRVQVTSRAALRRWLTAHHANSPGVWVVAFKKHTGKVHIGIGDIGEEALCFGWVDSKVGRVDEDRSMLLITPRKPKSSWSRVNKERIERLTAAGLMQPAGIAAVDRAKETGTWNALDDVERLALPEDLRRRFDEEAATARKNFEAFPRSAKRAILEWIQTAKKAETRAKRIEETVTQAAKGVRANQWRG
jgi:uncharacterized protein YdeI (YjbR/CyaY-like superfamily)